MSLFAADKFIFIRGRSDRKVRSIPDGVKNLHRSNRSNLVEENQNLVLRRRPDGFFFGCDIRRSKFDFLIERQLTQFLILRLPFTGYVSVRVRKLKVKVCTCYLF
jgi:hypothetical protein